MTTIYTDALKGQLFNLLAEDPKALEHVDGFIKKPTFEDGQSVILAACSRGKYWEVGLMNYNTLFVYELVESEAVKTLPKNLHQYLVLGIAHKGEELANPEEVMKGVLESLDENSPLEPFTVVIASELTYAADTVLSLI